MNDPRTVIRDKVAKAIHRTDIAPFADADLYRRQAEAAIAAHLEALEQAARIETVEQLTEAPPGTVIHIGDGPGGIYEKDRAGSWGYDAWGDEETAIMIDAEGDVVRVLYRPEEAP